MQTRARGTCMSVGQVFSCYSHRSLHVLAGARGAVPSLRRWNGRPRYRKPPVRRDHWSSSTYCRKSEEVVAVGSSAWWFGWAPAGHQQRTVAHPGTARPHRPATVCEYHPVYDEICGYCLYIFFKQRLIIWKAFLGFFSLIAIKGTSYCSL